jgi:ribosomal protein L7/L12
MVKLIFEGWDVGMRKIPFIKLLHEKAGLSLTEAKKMKDGLVDNQENIEIFIDNIDNAKEILGAAQKLKVKGRIEGIIEKKD